MVMRRVAVFAGFLLCALLVSRTTFASPPSAGPRPAPQDMFTLQGKITDKSAGKLTISSGENMIFHVLYNDKTEIRKKDGSLGAANDLHIGLTIMAEGDLAESGEITAKKITIQPEGSENKSAGGIPGLECGVPF